MRKIYFVLIFVLTVIVSKFFVYFVPFNIYGDWFHHAYAGVLLVLIAFFLLYKKKFNVGYTLLAVGLGVSLEELVYFINYLITGLSGVEAYFSPIVNIGTVIMIFLFILVVWKVKFIGLKKTKKILG